MARRTGNNYSGPRWAFSQKRKTPKNYVCNLCGHATNHEPTAAKHKAEHSSELFDTCQHCGHQRSFHGFYGCEAYTLDYDPEVGQPLCDCKRRQSQVVPAPAADLYGDEMETMLKAWSE